MVRGGVVERVEFKEAKVLSINLVLRLDQMSLFAQLIPPKEETKQSEKKTKSDVIVLRAASLDQ